MINKTQKARLNEELEDDSDYGKSVKEKSQNVQSKYLKKNLINFFFKITCKWKKEKSEVYSYLKNSRFCWKC